MDAVVVYQWTNEGEWIHDVQQDVEGVRSWGWTIADKMRCGVDQFGRGNKDRVGQLYRDMSAHTGLAVHTLWNLVSVSRQFPPVQRNASLTVSHHVALLGVDEDLRDYLMSEAEAQGMSVSRLRAAAHAPVNGSQMTNGDVSATEVDEEYVGVKVYDPFEDEEDDDDGGYWLSPNGDRIDSIEKVLNDEGFYYIPPKEEPARPPHVAHNSGNNEWYTPSWYVETARQVMGGIDLDPASSVQANETVGAASYYTASDDGLNHQWGGRVWMNPPYADGLVASFTEKLVDEYLWGYVEEAVVLVNNATETNWFQHLMGAASAIVFPRGRVRFLRPDGTTGDPLQGQALVYLGKQPERFLLVFKNIGWGALMWK
jgi:phage N-6-adenine-methyltransferase